MTSQQLQAALMGLSPEYQQRFEKERAAFFNDTLFPFDLPDNFDHYRFFCGSVTNERTLGISAAGYLTLFFSKGIEQYNIGNIVSICTASERANFLQYVQAFGKKEGCNPVEEWSYMRQSFERMTKECNDIIEPEMERMLKKLAALQHNLIKANSSDTGNYKGGKNRFQ